VYPAAKCQDTLEQMACAITCNPESYTYINMTTRTMTLCQNFTDELVSSCKYAQITGNTAVNNQTFLGNTVANKYFVQALSNIVTGLLGMTRFTMAVGNVSIQITFIPQSHLFFPVPNRWRCVFAGIMPATVICS